jgi:intein-encoded DNA endonuclease-like protein
MTIREISRHIHADTKKINNFMRDSGIPRRSIADCWKMKRPFTNCELKSLYWNDGLSISDIAKRFKFDSETIRGCMIRNGILRRPMRKAVMLSKKSYELDFNGNEKEIGYLLGVMYGDGSYCARIVRLCVKDSAFIERFASNLRILGYKKKIYKVLRNDGNFLLQVYSVNLKDFLASLTFEQLSQSQRIEFVNGFFDSEGYIGYNNRIKYRIISCFNTDKNLLIELQTFLKSIGIESLIRVSCKKGSISFYKGKIIIARKNCYVLSVGKKDSQRIFCKTFELFGRKQKKLNMIRRCID